jgi:type II secretory ATPase GspE/PulE/Tfp pilus assembly ATPase PilB-like protein
MSELVKERSIGAVLFKSGIITEEELKEALKEQQKSGCRIGEALVSLGAVTQEDIDWALAHQLDMPYVRLKRESIDPAALARVPGQLARRCRAIPLYLSGDELSIAIEDPLDREALDLLARETGCRLNVAVGLGREISEMLKACYGVSDLGFTSPVFSPPTMEAVNADPSAAKLLDHLLLCAVKRSYSQISLTPVGDRVEVVAREKGSATEIGRLAAPSYPALLARVRRLAQMERPDRASGIGTLWFLWKGKKVPFQVLLLGERLLTLKLHLPEAPLKGFEDLALAPEAEQELRELATFADGMVLVGGRESGGRCALLDLFLDARDHRGKTALLLGEGLGRGSREYARIPFPSHGGEAASLIRQALEHEPDLLAVEKLRDAASFAAATRGALRGTAVLAGVEAGGMAGLLERFLELCREDALIPGALKGVVFVSSARLLCPECKEEYRPAPEDLEIMRLSSPPRHFFRCRGCERCGHTGHLGRRYLAETIRFDAETRALLRHAATPAEIMERLAAKGYRGIAQQGEGLLARGEISPREYLAAIVVAGG